MSRAIERYMLADVICQHKRDKTLVPLKIRLADEDGEFHIYQVKAYKELGPGDVYCMPNEIVVGNNHLKAFDCKILVFDQIKIIRLFYNSYENLWKVYYIN